MKNAGPLGFSDSYKLSESTLNKIRLLREPLKDSIAKAKPAWPNVFGKVNLEPEAPVTSSEESDESTCNEDVEMMDATNIHQFTQFYATQMPLNLYEEKNAPKETRDIVLTLHECLEYASGKLNFNLLESLPEDDLIQVVEELEKKISPTGLCNLCNSMNSTCIEQRTRYAPVLLGQLVLPQILSLESPSRELISAIAETVQLCPDDIFTFVFVPLLNTDLQDTTLITTIVNAFGAPRKVHLIREFCACVNELKPWHVEILQNLLSIKLDDSINATLVQLFLAKANDFSKDMSFGKLLLQFVKTSISGTFAENHKDSLWDIMNSQETVFKRPLMNILDKM